MNYRISKRADADISEIWEYIARDSVGAADRVENALHEAAKALADNPGLGHLRRDLPEVPYRFFRVYSYMIAYRMRGRTLIVVRVIHGARDMTRMFRGKMRKRRFR